MKNTFNNISTRRASIYFQDYPYNLQFPSFQPQISDTSRKIAQKTRQHIFDKKMVEFRKRIRQRLNQQCDQDDLQSSIQEQFNNQQKQEIIQKFIERQEFKTKQTKLLKQMQQFIKYGCIREGWN